MWTIDISKNNHIVNEIRLGNSYNIKVFCAYGSSGHRVVDNRITERSEEWVTSDGVEAPFPGFLVGGPNGDRQDEMENEPGVSYPFKQPVRAYVDRMAAYASNDVSINWNAPLVFVLGFLNKNVNK